MGEFISGGFKEVVDDASVKDATLRVTKVLYAAAKIYFELAEKQKDKRNSIKPVIKTSEQEATTYLRKQLDELHNKATAMQLFGTGYRKGTIEYGGSNIPADEFKKYQPLYRKPPGQCSHRKRLCKNSCKRAGADWLWIQLFGI